MGSSNGAVLFFYRLVLEICKGSLSYACVSASIECQFLSDHSTSFQITADVKMGDRLPNYTGIYCGTQNILTTLSDAFSVGITIPSFGHNGQEA